MQAQRPLKASVWKLTSKESAHLTRHASEASGIRLLTRSGTVLVLQNKLRNAELRLCEHQVLGVICILLPLPFGLGFGLLHLALDASRKLAKHLAVAIEHAAEAERQMRAQTRAKPRK